MFILSLRPNNPLYASLTWTELHIPEALAHYTINTLCTAPERTEHELRETRFIR